jgi:5-methylcytosine-specific restriction endonuclease McrA
MTTHAFKHEPRVKLTDPQRAKLFLDRGGRCEATEKDPRNCGNRKITTGEEWHVEHEIALENGGTNDPSNLRVICPWCHAPKTAADHKKGARIRNAAVRHIVPTKQRENYGSFRKPEGKRYDWRKRRYVDDE